MSGDHNTYLMVIGDREALAWVLSTQQTAFPAARLGQVSRLAAGDRLFVYTTRGCFRNPTRDRGRVIACATVTAPVTRDDTPVRFGAREYPLRCPLRVTELAPFGSGPVLADLVEALHAFPDPRSWSVRLRRPLVPLDAHDSALLTDLLRPGLAPLDRSLPEYLRRGTPPGTSRPQDPPA
ncbi:hypothetical protein [Thermobifida halotolerans]|nr:hypothetical protein [Thermobifida halotolerans]